MADEFNKNDIPKIQLDDSVTGETQADIDKEAPQELERPVKKKKKKHSGEKALENSTKIIGGTVKGVFLIIRQILRALVGILLTMLLVGVISGIVVGCVFFMYVKDNFDPEFDIEGLEFDLSQTTTMWYIDDNGNIVELEDEKLLASENRTWAAYSTMPKNLVNAFTAVEDKRFREHNGVDYIRTFSAMVNFFIPISNSYGGGSTITQQLIKNFTGEDDVTIQRKIQEMLRAWNLESKKSKEEILEMYLNTIYLSQNSYGVQAAAMTYFGKDVSELTLVECAALAALPKSPTQYDPIRNPENNLTRRRTVLKLMYEQEYITWEQYREAYAVEELIFAEDDEEYTETIHSYYIDAVIDEVIADLMEQKGYSKEIASAYLYSGGLKIVTCMDPFVQESMESVYENFTFDGEEDTIIPQSAMVIMDPETGDVLGLVGGRGEKKESRGLNRATQSTRQCGSAIKPLSVYSPALENGFITYGTVIDDTPLVTEKADPDNPKTSNKTWPVNSPSRYRGLTTANYAVYRSLNTVSAKIVTEMTPQLSFDFLTEKLHFSTLVKSYTSSTGTYYTDIAVAPMAHGSMTFGVTVLDMCAGYTALANEGTYSAPRLYSVITDSSGTIILEQQEKHENVLKISTAYIMTKMLENVVTQPSGTGYKLTLNKKAHFPTLEVAGKTGTTAADRDRYFCGYTPYYVGAAWFGHDNNKVLSKYTSNPAMQLWDQVMILLHEKIYEQEGGFFEAFDVPGDVIEATYCKDSGMLLSDSCALDLRGDRSETGYFLIGTEPTEKCDKHIVVKWDSVTQAVACDCCPEENLVDIALVLNESRDFALQVYVTDAQYMYRPVDDTTVMPESYSGDEYPNALPFFYSTVDLGRYCGITRIKEGHAVNCYCWEHAALAPETSEEESFDTSTDVSADESADESVQESTVSIPSPWA